LRVARPQTSGQMLATETRTSSSIADLHSDRSSTAGGAAPLRSRRTTNPRPRRGPATLSRQRRHRPRSSTRSPTTQRNARPRSPWRREPSRWTTARHPPSGAAEPSTTDERHRPASTKARYKRSSSHSTSPDPPPTSPTNGWPPTSQHSGGWTDRFPSSTDAWERHLLPSGRRARSKDVARSTPVT
jgi:hypothetical protein